MNNSINFQIIKNLQKELNKSFSHLFIRNKYNNKVKRSKIASNKMNDNKKNKLIKSKKELISSSNNKPLTDRIFASKKYRLFNIQNNYCLDDEEDNYNYYNTIYNQLSLKRSSSSTKYLFFDYIFYDLNRNDSSQRSNSTLNIKIRGNENKNFIFNKTAKNNKIIQLRKNCYSLKNEKNGKNHFFKSKSPGSLIPNLIDSNKINGDIKTNLVLKVYKKSKSSEIYINHNNNEKTKLKNKTTNKIDKINISIKEQSMDDTSESEKKENDKKKKKNQKLYFLSKININSVMGSGNDGLKNINQDSIFTITNNQFISINNNNISNFNLVIDEDNQTFENIYTFLGICDGHGEQGKTISNYINKNIPLKMKQIINLIKNKITNDDFQNDILPKIKLIFNNVNLTLNSMQSINTINSGSCFCSLLITPYSIISINLGNSKALIGVENKDKKNDKKLFVPYNVTFEHTPLITEEKERVINNGGVIFCEKDEFNRDYGPLKIWKKKYLSPGLLTTRSFGDKEGRTIGVISEPAVQFIEMKSEYKFIVIGSRGLWDVISEEECVEIIGFFYLRGDISGALNHITKIAKSRWIEEREFIYEDISVIIGFMKEVI